MHWPVRTDYPEAITYVSFMSPSWDGEQNHTHENHSGIDIGYPLVTTHQYRVMKREGKLGTVVAAAAGVIYDIVKHEGDECRWLWREDLGSYGIGPADEELCGGGCAAGNCGGNYVVIDHGGRYKRTKFKIEGDFGYRYTTYAHLQKGSNDHLSVGDRVEIGEEIGKIGSSGQSSSPHLHFSVNMEGFTTEELAKHIDGLHGLGSLDGAEEQKEEIERAWKQENHYASTSVDPFFSWKSEGSNTYYSLWYDQCGLPIYPDDDRKALSVQVRPEPAPAAYVSWSQSVACGWSGKVACNIEPAQEYPINPDLLERMGGSCAAE